MPYIPESTQGLSGSIKIDTINIAFIDSVTDMHNEGKCMDCDVALRIHFIFKDCPPDWKRNLGIFARFDKDAQGNLVHSEENDKEIGNFLNRMEQLGLTVITRENRKITALKGVCVNEKGKVVLEDDTPVDDFPALIELLTKNKTYELYLNKKNGYDNILTYIDASLINDSNLGYKRFLNAVSKATSVQSEPSLKEEDVFAFVPGA